MSGWDIPVRGLGAEATDILLGPPLPHAGVGEVCGALFDVQPPGVAGVVCDPAVSPYVGPVVTVVRSRGRAGLEKS